MAEGARISPASADPMRAFIDALPDGMVLTDLEGRIVLVNALLEKLYGYASEELVGQKIEVLVPDRFRTAHRAHRDDYYQSGLPARAMGSGMEIFFRRKDGGDVPVDIALSTIQFGGRTLVLSAVRDATERKRAEAAIRESERRWRTVLENVRLVVVGLDLERRVTYANPFLRQLMGFTEEEILGRDWFELCLPPEVAGEVEEVFHRLLETESPAHYVNAIRTKSGQQRIIAWYNAVLRDPEGTPVGTLSIGDDITDRKRAQDRLEAVNVVAGAILGNRPLDEVLQIVAQRSRALVDASVATVVTPVPETDDLVVRVAHGEHASELEGLRFPAEQSISGHVMRSRETLALPDASTDPRVNQPVVRTAAVGPALFAPLAVPDRVFGTLLVGRPLGAPPFIDEDRAVIELFASQAAIALEHARFQEELHRLAVLEDRERIGRELHDGAIQALFGTGIKLQSALTLVGSEAGRRIEEAIAEIDEVIQDLRNYIFGLRPGLPGRGGIGERIQRLGEELQERAGVVTLVDIDPDVAASIQPAEDVEQLVREALSNVARHAEATTCRLFIGRVGDDVILEIGDDGNGFDFGTRFGTGQGLPNLHDRAAAIGASLEIESSPGTGTTVRVRFPD